MGQTIQIVRIIHSASWLGAPHEVASAVAYFAGEEAGFINGQTLSVSGGLTMA